MLVYGLYDNDGQLRYIGQTVNRLERRLTEHLWPSALKRPNYKNHWIKSLLTKGFKPEIQAIQELHTLDDLNGAEKYWINYFKEQGCDLVNGRDGGIGMRNPSSEVRARMSMAKKGKPSTRKGIHLSDTTKQLLRLANLGKAKTLETKAKMSLSHKARYLKLRGE